MTAKIRPEIQADADSASTEELETAASIWDRLVAGTLYDDPTIRFMPTRKENDGKHPGP